MSLCRVDLHRSPTYKYLLERHKARFPRIENDLGDSFWVDIARDYRNARQAESVPGFKNTIFKYRAKCSDMRRGARGGYRVIAYYHLPENTLFPLLLYHKSDQDDTSAEIVQQAIDELLGLLGIPKFPDPTSK